MKLGEFEAEIDSSCEIDSLKNVSEERERDLNTMPRQRDRQSDRNHRKLARSKKHFRDDEGEDWLV